MSLRNIDYAGNTVYIAEQGDPILAPDMMTVWGHFRSTLHMHTPEFRFITAEQFLSLPDQYSDATHNRVCKIYWEKGLWVCSDDTTQEDLAKCEHFLVHALTGPYAAICAYRVLREDREALEELGRMTRMDQQELVGMLSHLIQNKIDNERRRIMA